MVDQLHLRCRTRSRDNIGTNISAQLRFHRFKSRYCLFQYDCRRAQVRVTSHSFQSCATLRQLAGADHHTAALEIVSPLADRRCVAGVQRLAKLPYGGAGFQEIVTAKFRQHAGLVFGSLAQAVKYLTSYDQIGHYPCVSTPNVLS